MAAQKMSHEDKVFLRNVNNPRILAKKMTAEDKAFLKNANSAGFILEEIVRAARRGKRCVGISDTEISAYLRQLQDKYLAAISGEPTRKRYRR